MNGTASRFLRLGGSLAGLVLLGWVLTGQAAKPARHGIPLPTDWSHQHMIFSRPGSAEALARVSKDPRYWQQLYRREASQKLAVDVPPEIAEIRNSGFRHGSHPKNLKRDWSINLGSGASAGAENYPAKYAYDSVTANCGNATTPDYVVYGTGLASSASQASIVAFDNLYTGCGGTVPSTYWAYNTSAPGAPPTPGTVVTSPIASLDGTQVAFVQTDGLGHGTVVLLKWKANDGSIGTPTAPANDSAATYATCATPPCMVQFDLRDRSNAQTDDETSSIYYDFTNDIAWVGDHIGLLHQFQPFFKGTPAEVRNSTWPESVSGTSVSSPVFDSVSNNVFIGDASGFLHAVNATSGSVTSSGELDFGTGIIDGPVVDSVHGFVYVFASSDGTANCLLGATAVACSAVHQLTTTFASLSTGTSVVVGSSLAFGSTPNPLYLGGFDSGYYNSGTATGNLYVCGNTGANPTLYQVPISSGALASSNVITTLTSAGSTASCSPVTDVPNPNTTSGPSERLFVSVQDDGKAAACSSGGCVFNFVDAPWKPSTVYAVGQQILVIEGGNFYFETVSSVTSDAMSGPSEPVWGSSADTTRTDNHVTWISQGEVTDLATNTPASWLPSNPYGTNVRILDSNNNVEYTTSGGTSGGSTPAWNTAPNGTTSDGGVTWTNLGTIGTFALSSTGGSSGIISDNVVSPTTLAGASQIYFTTLGTQTCATSGTSGGCAVQASQPALQ